MESNHLACISRLQRPITEFGLKEKWTSGANDFSRCHDSDDVAEYVSFIHEMRCQENRAAGIVFLEYIPGQSTSRRVHSTRWLVQKYHLDDI